MYGLPTEIWVRILRSLPFRSRLRARAISRKFHAFLPSPIIFWKDLVGKHVVRIEKDVTLSDEVLSSIRKRRGRRRHYSSPDPVPRFCLVIRDPVLRILRTVLFISDADPVTFVYNHEDNTRGWRIREMDPRVVFVCQRSGQRVEQKIQGLHSVTPTDWMFISVNPRSEKWKFVEGKTERDCISETFYRKYISIRIGTGSLRLGCKILYDSYDDVKTENTVWEWVPKKH